MYEDMSKTKFGDFIEILLHMPHRRDPEVDAGTYYKLSIDTVFIGTARVPKFKTMLHLPSALKDSSCLERFNKTIDPLSDNLKGQKKIWRSGD